MAVLAVDLEERHVRCGADDEQYKEDGRDGYVHTRVGNAPDDGKL